MKYKKTYLKQPVYRFHKSTKERVKFVTLERLIDHIMDDFQCGKSHAKTIIMDLFVDKDVVIWQDMYISYSLVDFTITI